MSLSKFIPSTTLMSKDLIEIKSIAGGQSGNLSVGSDKVQVLKLGDNVYVTSDKVPKNFSSILNLDQADIHQVQTRADLIQFVERWKAFKHG